MTKPMLAVPIGPDGHVVIVGAGFSGTLLAVNLVRFDGPRVTLIERAAERIARGVAYSATSASQLLNVRAAGMSAYPDRPDHFAHWLAARGHTGEPFVARATYGDYLAATLAEARDAAGDRLRVVTGAVVAIDRAGGVLLDNGTQFSGDAVVLTLGNLPPHDPPGIDAATLSPDFYAADPWGSDPAAGLAAGDRIVLIGSGLTAIDVALKLADAGFAGEIVALSRRGLSPRRHRGGAARDGIGDPPDAPLSALVRQVRRAAAIDGWRAAIDALRPVTQRWWARADDATRRRFLRHLRPFWDVHRHRLAPAVAERIDALVTAGQLRFVAGKIVEAGAAGDGVVLTWRPRGADAAKTMMARRIVNCTGPQGDVRRSDDALLRALLAEGRIRPDALGLGIDVDAQGRVIGADGRADPALHCMGPMTRGSYWEIVAVPDLRRHCADLARRLSNAHWIGEGL